MAAGAVHRSPSAEQDRVSLQQQAALHTNYGQNDWEYSTGTHDPSQFAHSSSMWQGDMPLTSSYDAGLFDTDHTAMDGTVWPDYGTAQMNGTWGHAAHGSSDLSSYAPPAWTISPSDELSTYPWSPADQPLPSPLSEVPSYAFGGSPDMEDMIFDGDVYGSGISQNPAFHEAASQPGSPAITQQPSSKSKSKGSKQSKSKQPSSNKSSIPASTKRPPSSTPPANNNPRPRTLKRHKSDNPSISSTAGTAAYNYPTPSSTTSGHSTTTTPPHAASASTASLPLPPSTMPTTTPSSGTATGTTLGGVLPANVDPREAAEQIRRAAWDRCRAEAREMAQRRERLLDHDGGALERDALRLQVSLGRMREAAAASGQRGGLGRGVQWRGVD